MSSSTYNQLSRQPLHTSKSRLVAFGDINLIPLAGLLFSVNTKINTGQLTLKSSITCPIY
jgi:hypothetical protein